MGGHDEKSELLDLLRLMLTPHTQLDATAAKSKISSWPRDLRFNSDGTFMPRNGYHQKKVA